MPAERFYINADLTGILRLEGTEQHHMAHVMRIRVGEEIELVNGRGGLAQGKVVELGRQSATLEVLHSSQTPLPEPRLHLAIPLMRPSKLEFVIEKCTELGADRFYLYAADHSEKDDLSSNQLERLHHIAISAMKQCGRLDLPSIQMTNWEALFGFSIPCFYGDTRTSAKEIHFSEKILFITGPEKGFSDKELKILKQKGTGVRLNKNILRAETAPIAATCLLI